MLDKDRAIKSIVMKLTKTRQKNASPHFNPILVRGVVSRVQTALPSIRIRLRNLRPGFHPIFQNEIKRVSTVTFFWKTLGGARLKPNRMLPSVNDSK